MYWKILILCQLTSLCNKISIAKKNLLKYNIDCIFILFPGEKYIPNVHQKCYFINSKNKRNFTITDNYKFLTKKLWTKIS